MAAVGWTCGGRSANIGRSMSTAVVVSLALGAVAAAAFIAVAYVRRWEWAGFAGSRSSGQGPKTVWDWLQLLVIPLGLAAVAFALNVAQSGREQRREDRRAALERSIASDRRREDALGVYLQQMSGLMLDRGLLTSRQGADSRKIARTLTLSVLRRLDAQRKAFVLRFLREAGLIDPQRQTVSLSGADLRGLTLRGPFWNASLVGADLREADFRGSTLGNVTFRAADLRGADFSSAFLTWPLFEKADLSRANFSRARLIQARFFFACLTEARFAQAVLLFSNFRWTRGHDVDFSGATMVLARFSPTELWRINLKDVRVERGDAPPGVKQPSGKDELECGHAAR
jgi:uncharacterized protein YjbI with pentapeptide repeats